MSHLMLVRHGQGNLDGGPYDQLSPLGRLQAERLGRAWSQVNREIRAVYTGTLNRHIQTAEIVAHAYRKRGLGFPEVVTDTRFNEIDAYDVLPRVAARIASEDPEFGKLAERARIAMERNLPGKLDLFGRIYPVIMEAWIQDRYPDMEGLTWSEFRQRVLGTLAELMKFENRDRIVVFTSGHPMGVYVREALDLTPVKTLEVVDVLYNTNVTTFLLREGRLSLVSLNDTSHLEEDQRTRI